MTARKYDSNGFYELPSIPISRVGVFPYFARSIQAPGWEQEPDRIYQVYRPAEELGDPEAVESFRLLPWTDDHTMLGDPEQQEGLTPAEEKGVEGTLGEQVFFKDGTLYANLKLWSRRLATLIDSGKKELSCGFRCVYEFVHGSFGGQSYDVIQRRIRGNHIASVQRGRMGPGVAVLDHAVFTFDAKELGPMKIKFRDLIARRCGMDAATKALLVGTAFDADVEDPGEKTEPTLSEAMAILKDLVPKVAAMQEMVAKLVPAATATVDTPVDGMEPVLDSAGKPCMDSITGKPVLRAKAAATSGTGMDELRAGLKEAQATIKTLTTGGPKAVMSEIGRRDALAGKVSDFVGTFDHSGMTHAEVAAYGCTKLGLTPVAGQEGTALDAYLKDRTPPSKATTFALDTAVPTAGGKTSEYFKSVAA